MSEERHGAHVDREDVDGLFNAHRSRLGRLGHPGTEAGSDLNWFSLLRYRVQARRRIFALPVVRASERSDCFRRSSFDRFREAVRKSLLEVTGTL